MLLTGQGTMKVTTSRVRYLYPRAEHCISFKRHDDILLMKEILLMEEILMPDHSHEIVQEPKTGSLFRSLNQVTVIRVHSKYSSFLLWSLNVNFLTATQ